MTELAPKATTMQKFTTIVHWATVTILAVAVLGATGVGFAQSWAGLYGWALEHRLHGWKAQSFPAMVDLFIAIGELGLFKLAIEGHRMRKAWLPWLDLILPLGVAIAGWAVSLAFNVGHVGGTYYDQVTAAVPPIASMLGLFVLLRTLHRVITNPAEVVEPVVYIGDKVAVAVPPEVSVAEGFAEDAEPVDPAQRLREEFESSMKAAKESGLSWEAIQAAIPTTVYRVKKIVKPLLELADAEPETVSEINGHQLEPA
jgi:hypothetical protein